MNGVLIAWDIDGTLVQATERGSAEATRATAFATLFGYRPVVDFAMPGWTDRQSVEEILRREGIDLNQTDAMLDVMDDQTVDSQSGEYRVVAAPGALGTLERLGTRHTNVLLTGNTRTRTMAKILAAGLRPAPIDWMKSAFGGESSVRADLALRIAMAAHAGGQTALVIGDTPFDGVAAEIAGLAFCAVATGRFTTKELAETNAVLVLEDLVSGAEALDTLIAAL